jgi:Arc/MetJ-type ribon-helix-helix transcriptional regulator
MTAADDTTAAPYPEKMELELKPGTLKRIDRLLKPGESREDFVRWAVRNWLEERRQEEIAP